MDDLASRPGKEPVSRDPTLAARTRAARINAAGFLKGTHMVGPGLRDVLWVQGCTIGCPGCSNQDYLPRVPRRQLAVDRLIDHFRHRRGVIDGLSVLGGEPTEQASAVAELLAGVRSLGFSTVVFTGRTLESLCRERRYERFLEHTDLLIDGPYVERLRDPALHWRGSSNQRMIRLSDRFSERDLGSPRATGELVVRDDGVLLHGIGSLGLARALRDGQTPEKPPIQGTASDQAARSPDSKSSKKTVGPSSPKRKSSTSV